MKTILYSAVILAACNPARGGEMKISVTAPATESSVVERPIIEGTVSDATATVWVIVHPLEVSEYWVQPRVTVRESGIWKVQAFIGRTGTIDTGKLFEIRAVANPRVTLNEGQVLDQWPEAGATSNVIEVSRK